jgi:hypothetical protein
MVAWQSAEMVEQAAECRYQVGRRPSSHQSPSCQSACSSSVPDKLQEKRPVDLIDQKSDCLHSDWADEIYFRIWTELDVDIQAAGDVTVIASRFQCPRHTNSFLTTPQGKLGNLRRCNEFNVGPEGSVNVTLKFEVFGKVCFHTGNVELSGAHNFGATFWVPGIVTLGPDFRTISSLSGDALLKMLVKYCPYKTTLLMGCSPQKRDIRRQPPQLRLLNALSFF